MCNAHVERNNFMEAYFIYPRIYPFQVEKKQKQFNIFKANLLNCASP